MATNKFPIQLRVYDISEGKAALWSPVVLWKKIEGVWHTGIQIYGFEYFYGGGIQKMYPHDFEEHYRLKPKEVITLGYTSIGKSEFEHFLRQVGNDFSKDTYDLLKWNCNNFSDCCSKFLLGTGIPAGILSLPDVINRTLMGSLILKAVKAMRGNPPVAGNDSIAIEDRIDRIETATKCRRLETQQRMVVSPRAGKTRYSTGAVNPPAGRQTRGASLVYAGRGAN